MQTFEIDKPYNQQQFKNFLYDFLPDDFEEDNQELFYDNLKFIKSGVNLGVCPSLNLIVYEFETFSEKDPRITLTREVFSLMKKYEAFPNALCVFKNENSKKWRFSLITTDYEINEKGKIVIKHSNPRRFSYLLGENCKKHTPESMLFPKQGIKINNIDDLKKCFEIEVVTKEFYNKLFEWYKSAVNNPNVYFPNEENSNNEENFEQKEVRIIRFLTRILFVWFIKQKQLIPEAIFDINEINKLLKNFNATSETDSNYYQAILQNLFFATLNCPIENRRFLSANTQQDKSIYRYAELFKVDTKEIVQLFHKVPYLNGGIFECMDKSNKHDGIGKTFYLDGFSNNATKTKDGKFVKRAAIPNALFFDETFGLIPLLSRYNFTIEENTPAEIEVALDPELLGKVFENLLGTYNPETKETARKQTGSFYTPRQIVAYMVDESLKEYLKNHCDENFSTQIDKLFLDDFISNDVSFNMQIIDTLNKIKVLDPACGSGAFPMQVLNRLVNLHQKIDAKENTYLTKLKIIQNNLFGVDIQPIAMLICKLRFFISLIVEQQTINFDDDKNNYGIPTLPNLETKFIAANSLITLFKQQGNLDGVEIINYRKDLQNVRSNYFTATNPIKKQQLREQDYELRQKISSQFSSVHSVESEKLSAWNPYQTNSAADFFEPLWMFGQANFDVVIGNPPYIQLQKNSGKLGTLLEKQAFQSFAKTGDIYCLFYEKGATLLAENAVLCFITSNKWMRAGYGEKLRTFLAKQTQPKLLIDFAGIKVFENATVDTNILLFTKKSDKQKLLPTQCCVTKKNFTNLVDFVRENSCHCQFSANESWVILSPIEQQIKSKIEKQGVPLKDWNININYGIKTGFNEAFIIDTATKNKILENCQTYDERQRSEKLMRPLLRGRDIKRYSYKWADLWLICTFPALHLDIEEFPAIKNHLLSFGIERLEQSGKTYNGVKSRKKTNNKWFETSDNIAYYKEFDKPKIVCPGVAQEFCFAFDKNGDFCDLAPAYFISGKNLEFLTCLLNSKLIEFVYCNFYATQLGENGLRLYVRDIIEFPIIRPDSATATKFAKLLQQQNYSQIDAQVYALYKLNEQEISIIENS